MVSAYWPVAHICPITAQHWPLGDPGPSMGWPRWPHGKSSVTPQADRWPVRWPMTVQPAPPMASRWQPAKAQWSLRVDLSDPSWTLPVRTRPIRAPKVSHWSVWGPAKFGLQQNCPDCSKSGQCGLSLLHNRSWGVLEPLLHNWIHIFAKNSQFSQNFNNLIPPDCRFKLVRT